MRMLTVSSKHKKILERGSKSVWRSSLSQVTHREKNLEPVSSSSKASVRSQESVSMQNLATKDAVCRSMRRERVFPDCNSPFERYYDCTFRWLYRCSKSTVSRIINSIEPELKRIPIVTPVSALMNRYEQESFCAFTQPTVSQRNWLKSMKGIKNSDKSICFVCELAKLRPMFSTRIIVKTMAMLRI